MIINGPPTIITALAPSSSMHTMIYYYFMLKFNPHNYLPLAEDEKKKKQGKVVISNASDTLAAPFKVVFS